MADNLFIEKKKYSKILKDYVHLKTKNKPLWLIVLQETENIDFLLDWLEILSCDFVIKTEKQIKEKWNISSLSEIKQDLLLWFDFVLTDNNTQQLHEYFKNGITPIIPNNNHLCSILKEYDPLASEWNSYLYEDKNKWSMYYAIIRYLENYKFPYDNRNLVKNLIQL